MASEVLTGDALDQVVAALEGWEVKDDALHRTFVFKNFVEAFGFMTRSALLAEKSNHHPDWSNSYKRVVVNLSTHSAGGITAKDTALASAMNQLANA